MQLQADPKDLRVSIGMPFGYPYMPVKTGLSLAYTTAQFASQGVQLRLHVPRSTFVTLARSMILTEFLKTDGTHLVWIDGDMAWAPEELMRLVVLGTVMPVVGAAYPVKRDPLLYITPGLRLEPNEYGCLPVDALGLGFTCLRRDAAEALAATKRTATVAVDRIEIIDAFRVTAEEPGEDINFFADLRALGYQLYLDPALNPGHMGQKEYKGDVAKELGLKKSYAAGDERGRFEFDLVRRR